VRVEKDIERGRGTEGGGLHPKGLRVEFML